VSNFCQVQRRLTKQLGYSNRRHVTSRWRRRIDVTPGSRRATPWHRKSSGSRRQWRSSRRHRTSSQGFNSTPPSPSTSRSQHFALSFTHKIRVWVFYAHGKNPQQFGEVTDADFVAQHNVSNS